MIVKVGDIYEDCAYHPVLCTESKGDDVAGYSLLNGSYPRSCSIKHCVVRVLPAKVVAWKIKMRDRWLEAEKLWRESGWTPDDVARIYAGLLSEQTNFENKEAI